MKKRRDENSFISAFQLLHFFGQLGVKQIIQACAENAYLRQPAGRKTFHQRKEIQNLIRIGIF